MLNVFYSKTEKILFYIAENDKDTSNVSKLVEMLIAGADKLAELISGKREAISYFDVTKSNDHMGMRIFFVKTNTIPDGVRVLERKTMREWIEVEKIKKIC